jgi:uncharacterized protein
VMPSADGWVHSPEQVVLWGVVGVVAAVVVVDLLIHAVAIFSILPILERCPPFSVEPTSPSPDAERIEFPSADGLTLRGSLHLPTGPPVGLIVFCPELGGDHWSALWYCQGLLKAGFAILAFDFRNQGESDDVPGYAPIHWLTEFEVSDAMAAVDYATRRADLARLPLGLFGISRGGSAALVAAARTEVVRSVACEGAFSISTMSLHFTLRWASLYYSPSVIRLFPLWHIRLTLAMARGVSQLRRHCRYTVLEQWLPLLTGRRSLMIIDGRDTYVLPEISQGLFKRFPQPGSQSWVVEPAKHNLARLVDPEAFDRRVVEFFSQMLTRDGDAESVEKKSVWQRPGALNRPVSS